MRQVKIKRPKNSGYQPPSLILIKLAVQNAKSNAKNTVVKAITSKMFIFHSRYITTASSTAVIIMVDVTEIPYAAAKLTDALNSMMVTTTINSSAQFTTGT